MTPPFPNGPRPDWYRRSQWKASYSKRNGVHYVGDEVLIDITFPTPSYDTFQRTARFDNGTNGATLSTTPRAYYSGFSSVTGTPTYDSTHAYGALSCRFDAMEQFEWSYPAAVTTSEYARIYLYATAFPAVAQRIFQGQAFAVGVDAAGKPEILGGGALATSIGLNQWVRIEFRMDYPGQEAEIRLYNNPDSGTETESLIVNGYNAGANNVLFRIGNLLANNWGSSWWLDNVVARASDWPGPFAEDPTPDSPITYTVRDFYGTIISTGTFDESQSWFIPDPPLGGWQPGWYRTYLTGPSSDVNFADSYGEINFCVVRDDPNFVAMPAGDVVGGYGGEESDLVMKGVMGLGTSRFIISDAENYAADLANVQLELALTETYWTDTGTPDTQRPTREPWCTFPNGAADSPGQLAGVTDVVAALYPGCKYYEGPSNEPNMDATTAAKMQDFADAVHAGNPNAIAIGPSAVTIPPMLDWSGFLDAGGGDACDQISFHAYNAVTNGDMNLGKSTIQTFLDVLDSYGLGGKGLWQTESVGAQTPVYGVYHPRRARKVMMETLLFEQKGVPRERNNWWYDTGHGFWAVPNWIENSEGGLEPHAVLGRVLAEETWGKPFMSALDFGIPGNSIFLGNVYEGNEGITVALMATSFITDASVTLTVGGAGSSVTVVDGFGNESTEPVEQGRVSVSLTDVPSYVRLPVNATVSVRSVNDWPATGIGLSSSPSATTKEINGVSYPVIADNAYMSNYGAGTGIAPATFAIPGEPVELLWDDPQTIHRVLIWCGPSWQVSGTMIKFNVDTSDDGMNWVTRGSISKDTPGYFLFGTESTGCFVETYWDEQWVFDVLLAQPINASGLRIDCTEAAYGGEPLASSGFGQGNNVESFRIQEVGVFSVGEAQESRSGGGAPPKGLRKRKAGDGEIVYQSYIILSG